MGVYIKGMEIPIEKSVIIQVYPDGTVRRLDGSIYKSHAEAVPVPPHGRLGDLDALTAKLKKHRDFHSDGSKSGAAISNGIGQCLDIINGKECPTIIPADPGEEEAT